MPPPVDRDQWYLVLAGDVSVLGPELLSRLHVPDTPLAAAAVLLTVFVDDRRAIPSYRSARRLLTAGVVEGDEREVAEALVQPARRRWWEAGVPVANWWDPSELLSGLVERLAPAVDDDFLITALAASPRNLDVLRHLSPALPGLPAAPSDLLAKAADDPAVRLLAGLAERPALKAVVDRQKPATILWAGPVRPPRWDRPDRSTDEDWLRTAWTIVRTWQSLRDQIRVLDTGWDSELQLVVSAAQALCDEQVDACLLWLEALGPPEEVLFLPRGDTDLRRRRFLDAHLRIRDLPFLLSDAVPDQVAPDVPAQVPSWVADDVFNRGGRFVHRLAGAHALWTAVAETDGEELLFEGGRRGAAVDGPRPNGDFVLNVVPRPDDPGLADVRMPYLFSPNVVEHAIEIVLLEVIDHRLDFYRLYDEARLAHVGTVPFRLPERATPILTELADSTLERLERDYPNDTPFTILMGSRLGYEQAPLMVTGVDHAKSEALLSALTLPDDPELRAARQDWADAELRRVSSVVDRAPAISAAADEARRAENAYRTLRQRFTPTSSVQFPGAFADIVVPGRAFVQFAEQEGFLSAGVVLHDGDRVRATTVDLSAVTVSALRRAVQSWRGRTTHTESERDLVFLLDQLGELVVGPVIDVLRDDVTHLVLSPSRALEPLPLHAARVGAARLHDLFDISYTPSAAVLQALLELATRSRRFSTDRSQHALVVASSGSQVPASADLTVIPGPEEEARLLGAFLPGATVRVDELDARTLADEMARYAVVHLAAHGEGRAGDWDSGLWIGGPTPSAAYLSGAAVLAGPALDTLSLLVLNACETAVDLNAGVAVQAWRGLDAAFLARGTHAVVSSLWPIEDHAAAVWSVVFHAERSTGTSAVRASKLGSDAVRTGMVAGRARELLDRRLPGWRDRLHAAGDARPLAWAAWRASGACW